MLAQCGRSRPIPLSSKRPSISANAAAAHTTAVVLAAGLGSRLQTVHAQRPKGFVEIGGTPIIARSVRALWTAGVRDFVFVVGWQAEAYRAWCHAEFPAAVCVDNAAFASTGSLSSLVIGAAAAPGRDLVVVESDLLYEQRALEALFAAPSSDTILISGFTQSRDEVWVYERAPGVLAQLSKGPPAERQPVGELVGLSRFSARLVAGLARAAQSLPAAAHYEDGLNALAATHPVSLLRIADLAWCEIDDPQHLERARNLVWPRVQRADAHVSPVS